MPVHAMSDHLPPPPVTPSVPPPAAPALPRRHAQGFTQRFSLPLKVIAVGLLSLALLIPLAMIQSLVADRKFNRNTAIAQVTQSTAQAQRLAAPVLVVPYVQTRMVSETDRQGRVQQVPQEQAGQWVFFPEQFSLDGQLQPATRRLGLHEVRTYRLTSTAKADFTVTIPADDNPDVRLRIDAAQLRWEVSDVRGFVGTPSLQVDAAPVALQQGAGKRNGLHAPLHKPLAAGQTLRFSTQLQMQLDGTESLQVLPLADDNTIHIRSPWPHPQFNGDFLPRQREVRSDGFTADWHVSSLASHAQSAFTALGDAEPVNGQLQAIGVSLVDPVNRYLMAERATKYGVLFVLLTFAGFLLLEVLKRLRIHPVQYVLVGVALAMFFLLLLSLSEHIVFGLAYLAAAVACLALLGFYVGHVLHSRWRGLGFAAALGLLYAALYGLLISEDNALVLGSALLFVLLAAVMVLTRGIDWYNLGDEVRR